MNVVCFFFSSQSLSWMIHLKVKSCLFSSPSLIKERKGGGGRQWGRRIQEKSEIEIVFKYVTDVNEKNWNKTELFYIIKYKKGKERRKNMKVFCGFLFHFGRQREKRIWGMQDV